jgi:4-carboxymuconolactone decarboxylase
MGDGQSGRLQRGLALRREVLGDQHVANSLAAATEFSRPIQEYITETCWGDVWTRPGLDLRSRSLVTLAFLTALNRMTELGVHVRGARRNGCTEQEIQEVLLQAAAYCGAPAALEAFRVAEKVLAELRGEIPAARDGAQWTGTAGTSESSDNGAASASSAGGTAPATT